MSRFLVVLFALCAVPSIISAVPDPLYLTGYVYCDTCLCGFETTASKPLAGAHVKVQCTKRADTSKITYTKEVVTGSDGQYKILVYGDYGDDICDAMLVKSSDSECSIPNEGRDQARVILTRNNGMASNKRSANGLGFLANRPLASCPQILLQYQDQEAED